MHGRQQFLTNSPWPWTPVLGALQQYVAERFLLAQTSEPDAATDVTAAAPTDAATMAPTDADTMTDAPWETAGVFTLYSPGFAKRGRHSAGVARQYSGALGRVDNGQIGVFLGYAMLPSPAALEPLQEPGRHLLVDGRLWLPRGWTDDPARCRRAGVPGDVLAAGD